MKIITKDLITKEFFKDDRLFDDKDEINIRENSFIQILEKLETFNLSDTQDDVKGIAFEEFLFLFFSDNYHHSNKSH